jgi:hypothetical protein
MHGLLEARGLRKSYTRAASLLAGNGNESGRAGGNSSGGDAGGQICGGGGGGGNFEQTYTFLHVTVDDRGAGGSWREGRVTSACRRQPHSKTGGDGAS